MILLIPELNILNYPLCLFLSLIHRVKVYKMPAFLYRFKGSIEVLNLEDYFDWNECAAIRSEAVDIWEDVLPKFPSSRWKLKIRGQRLDLSLKAKQELQHEAERLLLLKYVVGFHQRKNEQVRIINSLKVDYLSSLDRMHNLFCLPTTRLISNAFVVLDRINFTVENFIRAIDAICQFISGFLRNKKRTKTVRYLCTGISASELSTDKERLAFPWLVDEGRICKDDILFLLPKADIYMKSGAVYCEGDGGFLVTDLSNMLKFSSRQNVVFWFPALLAVLIKDMLFSRVSLEHLLLTKYAIRIICWIPVIESLNPKVYIDSISSMGLEDPASIYFNEIKGMKTVLWAYGTASHSFCKDKKASDSRRVFCSHIISSDLIVWNKHYQEFIEEHPQGEVRTHAIGPLMCGDEDVMNLDRKILFKKTGTTYDDIFKYVAVFDSACISPRYKAHSARCHHPYSEKYNYEFVRDMYRLLSDFRNVILIYKPKRSCSSERFSYSSESKGLFRQMARDRSVAVLDYDINPWVPIAMADICISIPFESPTIAAIHYEKTGLFHDPSNIALCHRYGDFQELITHSYEELKSKMAQSLNAKRQIKDMLDEDRMRKIQGRFPGENSTDKFREYLTSL